MQMPVNVSSPLQQGALNDISRIKVVLYFIHEVCIVDEVISTTSQCRREWKKTAVFHKSVHLGKAYSGSHARMAIPFLKWDRGSLMTLGMGIKYFNSSGYNKWREWTTSICPQHFGNMLFFGACGFWMEGHRTFSLVFSQKGISSPSSLFFFSKDICHWTLYKSFRLKVSC